MELTVRFHSGGGGTFVVVYLACVLFICCPIMVAELAVGRRGQQSPVGSFAKLCPGTRWWLVGALGVLAGAGILSFYSVIAGWTVAYIWFTATGVVGDDQQTIGAFFANFTANGPLTTGLALLVLTVTAGMILGGVRAGIERFTKALMPFLIGLLLLLAIRALTLPGAGAGLVYYLRPDLSRIFDVSVFSAALGQAFFSLSLGMGAMITYGSYLSKRNGIASSAVWVVLLDTSIALLAGFIIFPFGFAIDGFDPSSGGPGLVFTVLPRLFTTLPGGQLFGAAFFMLLTTAALTSMIALLEVPVSYLVDSHYWSRSKAVAVVTVAVFSLAISCALANGSVGLFTTLPGLKIDFLTLMVTVWSDFALPIGGLLTAFFVGWVWEVDRALEELLMNRGWFPVPGLWAFLIRWVCPLGIFFIIVTKIYSVM